MSVDFKKMDALRDTLREAVSDLTLDSPSSSVVAATKLLKDVGEITDLTVRVMALLPNVDRRMVSQSEREAVIRQAVEIAVEVRALVFDRVSGFDVHAPLVADLSTEI